jgi:phospholipid/cholesterol/gamma-HCH transport system substrate-binding protein
VVVALLVGVSLNLARLQEVFGQEQRQAAFAESGGLRSGDDVRVNGVKVGRVKEVRLGTTSVEVTFTTNGISLGDRTTAAVKSANALGRKFLAITPQGAGDHGRIPVGRTDAGLSVNEVLGDLTATSGQLDVEQLARSFESVATVMKQTPEEFRDALDGVSRLSEVIANRDAELTALLKAASNVSGVLAERNNEITTIMSRGSQFLDELQMRRAVVTALLRNVRGAARELQGLAEDNRQTLTPALTQLREASRILADNRDSIEFAVQNLGGFVRALGEAVGSGPFFMAYLQNLNGANFIPQLPGLMREMQEAK